MFFKSSKSNTDWILYEKAFMLNSHLYPWCTRSTLEKYIWEYMIKHEGKTTRVECKYKYINRNHSLQIVWFLCLILEKNHSQNVYRQNITRWHSALVKHKLKRNCISKFYKSGPLNYPIISCNVHLDNWLLHS